MTSLEGVILSVPSFERGVLKMRPLNVFSAAFNTCAVLREPFIGILFWVLAVLFLVNPEHTMILYQLVGILGGTMIAEALCRVYGWKRNPDTNKALYNVAYYVVAGLLFSVFLPEMIARHLEHDNILPGGWSVSYYTGEWIVFAHGMLLDWLSMPTEVFTIKTLFMTGLSIVVSLERHFFVDTYAPTKDEDTWEIMQRKEGTLILVVMFLAVALLTLYAGVAQGAFRKKRKSTPGAPEDGEQEQKNE